MTDQTLATYSNLSIYSAMAVLTLAMILYAVHLARLMPSKEREPKRELVPVGAEVGAVGTDAGVGIAAGDSASTLTGGAIDCGWGNLVEEAWVEPAGARKAAGMAWMLTLLGTALVVLGVALRAAEVHRWPLGNMYEFAIVGSMFALLVYCGWALRRDLRWLGLFVVTPVLLTLGLAITVWYTDAAELMPSLKSVWLAIHVTVATLSVALFGIGASIALIYLIKDRVPLTGKLGFLRRLPEGPALEKLAYGLHIVAFPLWTFTLIAGAIWARQAWGAYWNWDPKEVWTFVIWAVYAAYLHARATTGVSRRAATWIAVAGFACIIINYAVVNMWFVGQHSYSGIS